MGSGDRPHARRVPTRAGRPVRVRLPLAVPAIVLVGWVLAGISRVGDGLADADDTPSPDAFVTIGGTAGRLIPLGFLGLSLEYPAVPGYAAAAPGLAC